MWVECWDKGDFYRTGFAMETLSRSLQRSALSIAREMHQPPALQRSAMWGGQGIPIARDLYGISIGIRYRPPYPVG